MIQWTQNDITDIKHQNRWNEIQSVQDVRVDAVHDKKTELSSSRLHFFYKDCFDVYIRQ